MHVTTYDPDGWIRTRRPTPEEVAAARIAAGGHLLLQRIRRVRAAWAAHQATLRDQLDPPHADGWRSMAPQRRVALEEQVDMLRDVLSSLDGLLLPEGDAG